MAEAPGLVPKFERYLGTMREDDALNILSEFVPGGSISSLLEKFGPFPESVVQTNTRQLLLGLEYPHNHAIMQRDIKLAEFPHTLKVVTISSSFPMRLYVSLISGANILVDNKEFIKLADFGASTQVAELESMS